MKQALITVMFVAGLAAIAAGCWLLAPAAGLIIGGGLVAYVAHELDDDAGTSGSVEQ